MIRAIFKYQSWNPFYFCLFSNRAQLTGPAEIFSTDKVTDCTLDRLLSTRRGALVNRSSLIVSPINLSATRGTTALINSSGHSVAVALLRGTILSRKHRNLDKPFFCFVPLSPGCSSARRNYLLTLSPCAISFRFVKVRGGLKFVHRRSRAAPHVFIAIERTQSGEEESF